MLLEGIILKSFIQINEERTAANIYHLLKGKRSIQTVQDAHIYGITEFFGVYKSLSRHVFDVKIEELINKGYLTKYADTENKTFIKHTDAAAELLKEQYIHDKLQYFHGLQYHEKSVVFYQRLLLLVQTLSNTKQSTFTFIPVIDNTEVEIWVKEMYKNIKGKENNYLLKLEEELSRLLTSVPVDDANIFVDRLSGYMHYGKSIDQLAESYSKGAHDIRLLLTGLSHHFLFSIEREPALFPACKILVSDLKEEVELLGSTKHTYKLFKDQHSPETIAQIRQLKINTIYDHFTEIALYDPHFPFSKYVSKEEQQDIMKAIQRAGSYKLKAIKEHAHLEVSYFQIRLMLILHQKVTGAGGLADVN